MQKMNSFGNETSRNGKTETAGRKYIDYEIQRSIARGNGLVGIQINHLKNAIAKFKPKGYCPF